MKHYVVVAALVAAGLLTGCGFVPKKPPKPNTANRVPVNLTAPFARITPAPVVQPVKVDAENVAGASPSSLIEEARRPAPVSNEQHSAPTPEPLTPAAPEAPTTQVASIANVATVSAVWPVTLAFKSTDMLAAQADPLAIDQVTFSWPESVMPMAAPVLVVEAAEAPAPAKTFTVELTSVSEPQPSVPINPVAQATTGQEPEPATAPEQPEALRQSATERTANEEAAPAAADIPEPAQRIESPATPLLTWEAKGGMRLSDLMIEWAYREDWTVSWPSKIDFGIEAPFVIEAPDFMGAAGQVFKAYRALGCEFAPMAYRNKVLEVKTPKECRL